MALGRTVDILKGNSFLVMYDVNTTVNSEKIALVYSLRFLQLDSDAKLKFAMINAATLIVYLSLHVRKVKKRKNRNFL